MRVSPTAVLLLAVFALVAPPVCLAAVLLAAGCHEAGHYMALRLSGGRLAAVSVSAFGAQMRVRERYRLSYGREALCVLAGPLINGTLSWLLSLAGARREELYIFAGAQLILGVFNLLPVPPFDGSRIALLFLPQRLYFKAMKYERYIMLAVLALVFLGLLNTPLSMLVNAMWNLMLRLTGFVELLWGY